MKIAAVKLGNKLNDAIGLIHEAYYKITTIDKERAQRLWDIATELATIEVEIGGEEV